MFISVIIKCCCSLLLEVTLAHYVYDSPYSDDISLRAFNMVCVTLINDD